MILEFISSYCLNREFVCQLAATSLSYLIINSVLFYRVRWKRYQIFKYYQIPGPEPHIIDGNLHLFRTGNQDFKVHEELCKRYGKYYGIFIGDEPSFIVKDLNILKQVFLERMSSFKERSDVFLDSPLTNSILLARYERWRAMRKVMSPAFSAYVMRGESSTKFIEDSIKLMLEYIDNKLDTSHINMTEVKTIDIDIHDLMKATALHLISRLAIELPDVQVKEGEVNVTSLDSYLSACDKGIITLAIKFPFLRRILSFLSMHFEHGATMAQIHRGLNSRIDAGFKSLSQNIAIDEPSNLLNTFIKLHYEGKLSRYELMGNAEAILIAGYDTTSTTLAYIFWTLGKHIDVQERLRSEMMAHGIDSKYLEQVINETMRIYPTVLSFTCRLATETVELDGVTIPQGCRVVYETWLLHRNPELWPEPEKFDPDRFEKCKEIHPCAFAPFGIGERKCLGYQLALLELKMITCDILLRYRLKTQSPDALDLVTYANVLTKPKDKIIVQLEKL